MLRVDYKIKYGVIKYRQASDNKVITIDIHMANALCAFCYHYTQNGEKWTTLVSFYADEQHIKNIEKNMKGDPLFFVSDCGKLISIKLNLRYKESHTLLKHFTKAGYKVECFYKE